MFLGGQSIEPWPHFLKDLVEKRLKILVGINTLTSISRPAYSNHCQFWYRLGRNFPDIDFILNNPERMSIDYMRNMSAKFALENDCDYLFFIDDDVLVPFDALKLLLAANADIAAGWTLIRGYPYKNMFFRWKDGIRQDLENHPYEIGDPLEDDGTLIVGAVGFSCCLIKMDLVRRVTQPYFITGPYNTEDIYFCCKAQKEFPDTRIVVVPQVLTTHMMGLEGISPLNRKAYTEYFEKMNARTVEALKEPEKEHFKKMEPGVDGQQSYEDLVVKDCLQAK